MTVIFKKTNMNNLNLPIDDTQQAPDYPKLTERILQIAEQSPSGSQGKGWNRDQLYAVVSTDPTHELEKNFAAATRRSERLP